MFVLSLRSYVAPFRLNRALLFVLCVGLLSVLPPDARGEIAEAKRGMVATVHPLATDAAVAVLQRGGNAVDAAVAAALTLGVCDSHNSGIGGGCFILIRTADGKLIAIDGRETAPHKATRDMYLRDGRPKTELSQTGPLAVATPGALAAYDLAVKQHGRRKFAELLLPAAKIAEEGFPLDGPFADDLKSTQRKLSKFEGSRAALLKPDGSPYAEGETLRQPDLARTYRLIAEHGTDWFYNGEFAAKTAEWMKQNGGLLDEQDFAAYRAKLREPVVSTYRGYTIVGFPPPSSGGTHVAQILNTLEHFDLKTLYERDPALFVHVVAEAMKLAFADRAYWLGDADFAPVPRGLVDKEYAATLAAKIQLDKAVKVEQHGLPPAHETNLFSKHTTHIAAADAEGNWVGITATVNTTFGSKVIVPGLGVVLNNEMDDFSIALGTPNAFGLVGAEANAVAPGKRPLSSMSPTIVLKDGQPVMTVGAAGGPRIITEVLLAIVRRIDLDLPLDRAVGDPRFHHQWSPDVLYVERRLARGILPGLEARGHKVDTGSGGICQAIAIGEDGRLQGVHDPRISGKSAGW
jgi:gamma-glutamyltranspeptidase/glutathione hydrolase